MTSKERHDRRYERRQQHRKQKQTAALVAANDFDRVISYKSLYAAARKCRKGVYWKDSVRRFYANLLLNLAEIHTRLEKGQSCHQKTNHFVICERGHMRAITSHRFGERVVQTAINSEMLVPMLTRSLIYDNGASQTGKGTDFAADRLETAMHRYFDRHGNNRGAIALLDFHDFFGSIVKAKALGDVAEKCTDPRLMRLLCQEVKPGGDVGIGLGSPLNQTLAVNYVNRCDHRLENMPGVEAVGVYMDDRWILAESREVLRAALAAITQELKAKGLQLNTAKTKIVPINKPFRYCQTRYFLSDSGAVVRLPMGRKTTRWRHKMKAMRRLYDAGKIPTCEDIRGSYVSTRATYTRRNARRVLLHMDGLFTQLFVLPGIARPLEGDKNGKCKKYHR
ncbi:MAG: reverse transcriptase domain-containing protein [Subdoligranulum variabile]|nr:reverse transcriptase domain-containing protein [Subdoligranulum variabile]